MSAPPAAEPPAAERWPLLSPAALMARVVDHFHGPEGSAPSPQPAPAAASREPKKPPPALTLDRDYFLARLVSFKTGEHAAAWAAQPAAIGPVACARKGWMAAPGRKELTVTCRECLATLLCKARPMPWDSCAEAAKVLAPKLQDTHHAQCPWRSYTFGADEGRKEEQDQAAAERKEEDARRAAAAAAELPRAAGGDGAPQVQRWSSCFAARPTGGSASAQSCNATAALTARRARGAEQLRCWPQPPATHCICCVPASDGKGASASNTAADGASPGTAPFVMPPDTGSGFQSPFRVTLISAVALVGAAVGLLTCFYLMRAWQQAARLRELRLTALERRQQRRRRRRRGAPAVPAVDEGGGESGGEASPRPMKPVVEVVEPGGEVDIGVPESDDADAAPVPAGPPARPSSSDQPAAAAPLPRGAMVALEVAPPAPGNARGGAPEERPVADQSARALMLIARVRHAFDGLGAAVRARRQARRDAAAAAANAADSATSTPVPSDRLHAAAAVGEDGTVRITIQRAP